MGEKSREHSDNQPEKILESAQNSSEAGQRQKNREIRVESGQGPTPEMKVFFEKKIGPTLLPLMEGGYRLPEIQAHYNQCCAEINQRYGKQLKISLSTNESKFSAGVDATLPFSCNDSNGTPEAAVYVPVAMKVYEDIKRVSHDINKTFEAFVVVGILHEMDHLSLGLCGSADNSQKLIEDETVVWARTCETVIKTFAETHRFPISKSEREFYSAWVDCGRDVNSEQWKRFIMSMYGNIKRR